MSDTKTLEEESAIKAEETANDQAVIEEGNDQGQEQKIDKEFINSIIEERLKETKDYYQDKLKKESAEKRGLDRKVTELQKQLREFETEKLTEAEKFELEKKDLQERRQQLYRELAIAKHGLVKEDDEDIDFNNYLYGDDEDEIMAKAEGLKSWIDKQIQKGVEVGVEERLAQGYKPKRPGLNNDAKESVYDMTRDELRQKAIEVSKLPSGEEKDRLLQQLEDAQNKLMGGK